MRGSSRTKRLLIVVFFSALVVVGVAPPCFACSCIASTDQEYYQRADVVFTGRATERHDPSEGGPQGSADPIHWTFDVDGTQKGKVADPVVVETSRDEASCGFTFVEGRRYQVYATNTGEYLHTDLCAGTRELNANQGPYMPAPPTQAPSAPPAPPTPAPTAAATSAPSPTPTASATPQPIATPSPTATDDVIAGDSAAADSGNEGAVIGLVAAIGALAASVFFWRRSGGRA